MTAIFLNDSWHGYGSPFDNRHGYPSTDSILVDVELKIGGKTAEI